MKAQFPLLLPNKETIMPYLTKDEILAIFEAEATANGGAFWSRVLPSVDWTVMGRGPGTGRYTDLATLRAETVERLEACMQGGLQLKFVNVIVGGDNANGLRSS